MSTEIEIDDVSCYYREKKRQEAEEQESIHVENVLVIQTIILGFVNQSIIRRYIMQLCIIMKKMIIFKLYDLLYM